jgi:hypothetical protein
MKHIETIIEQNARVHYYILNLAAPPLSTLGEVSSLASGALLLSPRSLVVQGTQAYSVL